MGDADASSMNEALVASAAEAGEADAFASVTTSALSAPETVAPRPRRDGRADGRLPRHLGHGRRVDLRPRRRLRGHLGLPRRRGRVRDARRLRRGRRRNVVATTTTANDGSQMTTVSGDAEVNEYTLALACADDPSLADVVAFRVSFTPRDARAPPPPDERRADARADGAVLEITPSARWRPASPASTATSAGTTSAPRRSAGRSTSPSRTRTAPSS
ncbi:hypothetical protein SO694_00029330 [Aureococcus anophagefferens]|uniref:Cadherin domain-containing protein n=1 Tax=Aureococcus anophagefferens TaxID=44056 RepID=A0ABR1FW30_AURAN